MNCGELFAWAVNFLVSRNGIQYWLQILVIGMTGSSWRHRMGSIKMGIGLGLWHHGMPDAATLFEYIDKAEAWGIDSVVLSDHLMGARQEVAIMPMMAAIAARTQRLKFGPSVMMLPLRHPITVAKEIATLDFLAPGRVIMAVGLGADEHEAEAFNVPLKQR